MSVVAMTENFTRILNFIGGKFVEPISSRYLDNIEPATGKPYSQVADSDTHDVDLAVAAAEKAFTDWSKRPAGERSRFLLRIADLIERDLEKFARAESIDTCLLLDRRPALKQWLFQSAWPLNPYTYTVVHSFRVRAGRTGVTDG